MKKKSLFRRILLSFVLLLILPMVLIMAFYRTTVSPTMERQASANVDFYIDQTLNTVDNFVGTAKNILYQSMLDPQIRGFMKEKDAYRLSEARNHLNGIIGRTELFMDAQHKDAIQSVNIVREDGKIIAYSSQGIHAAHDRRILEVSAFLQNASSPYTLYRGSDKEDTSLYFVLDYKDVDNMRKEGKAIVQLDPEKMVQPELLTQTYPGSIIILRNEEEASLYENENYDGLTLAAVADTGFYHVLKHGEISKLRVDILVPTASVYGGTDRVTRLFFLFAVAVILVVIFIGILEYRSFGKAIYVMTDTLGKMADSAYRLRMPESEYTELANVSSTFNYLADNLEKSFEDAYQKGIMLEKSEYRLLSAQINPHFVFNVLETIHMRCITAGQREISDMVINLAKLLRGNIGVTKSAYITVESELDYIHYYIELQKSRFGEKLKYSVDYEDEELLAYRIPRLTIQPIVENAVVHGLEPRSGMGEVSVRIWEEEDMICVRVEDNGVGFDADHMDYQKMEENNRSNHVAIPNIIRRLELIYGGRASMNIESEYGSGTRVMVTIPKWIGDNHA